MAVHGLLLDVLTRRWSRIAMIGMGIALTIGGLGAGVYYLWPKPSPMVAPPAATVTELEARKFIAGEEFNKLPVDQRIAWVDQRMQKMSEMDDEARRKLWQDMDERTRRRIGENMRAVMEERRNRDVDAYHRLPPSERMEFLDKRIDEMQQAMERGRGMFGPPPGPDGPGGPPGPGGPGGPPGSGNGREPRGPGGPPGPPPGGPGQMMARMAKMPADRRARIESFMQAMGKRMAQRGIGPPGPPPGPPR